MRITTFRESFVEFKGALTEQYVLQELIAETFLKVFFGGGAPRSARFQQVQVLNHTFFLDCSPGAWFILIVPSMYKGHAADNMETRNGGFYGK